MTKTPEQMAEEYGDYFAPGEDNKAYTSVIKEIILVLISGNGWRSHDVATFGPTVWRDK